MATKCNHSVVGSFLAVTLVVVVVATSSLPEVSGDEKAAPTCPGEYSKLCGKEPACTTMVETACRTDVDSVASIEGMFTQLAQVGGDNYGFASTEWPWGHVALCAAVNKHGACPGNKTVEGFAGEHCISDLNAACQDPGCTDDAYIECYRTAARFCYIKATPADKKAIQENLDCFKRCCAKMNKSEKCRKVCILDGSS